MSATANFRRNLRARRKAGNLSQEALAGASGYSVAYISRIERGVYANPGLTFVEVMAKTLGCEPGEMLA